MLYELANVTFSYNTQQVLTIEQLRLEKGLIYSFVGANGAGKTTLLKILSGLFAVASGSLWYQNELINNKNYRFLRGKCVYVHQNPLLLTGSVFANAAYGLKIRKYDKETIKTICDKYLFALGLGELASRPSENLSQGEIKRTAIARALAVAPEVLLLDEPSANVDENSLLKIQEVLLKVKSEGMTVIFSSHDNSFIKLADQVFTLKNGSVVS
jgi:tungstate transport system ATP-binding protein